MRLLKSATEHLKGGTFTRLVKLLSICVNQAQSDFLLNPLKAYSEVLEKSIGGPRKWKEVFELGAC